MNSPVIFITPGGWLIVSTIFFALSFFMPRRIPWIVAGTTFITSALTLIYPLLLKTGPFSILIQITFFLVLLILGLLFIQIPTASTSSLKKGDELTLTNPIQKGEGQETIDEKTYTLIGPDCPEKSQVTVVSIHNTTLYVQPKKR